MIRHLRPPVDVDALVANAVARGRVVRLVVAGETKSATLAAFADALDFPGWFGGNLDALATCSRTSPGTRTGRLSSSSTASWPSSATTRSRRHS